MNTDDSQRQQDAANSYRRKMALRRTPEENMRLFCQMQQQAYEVLKSNPDAMRHFHQRNHRKRRQSEVDRLLKLCKGTDLKALESSVEEQESNQ